VGLTDGPFRAAVPFAAGSTPFEKAMANPVNVLLVGALFSALPSARAVACSVIELRASAGYMYRVERVGTFVDSADVIVRAVATGADSSGRRPMVTFTPIEWIRGDSSVGPLHIAGTLVDRDDFNPRPVPYTTVRPGGQRGDCYARQYRVGAEYLLLLRSYATQELSPYWKPLAPLNEQVRSPGDAWVVWVRSRVRAAAAGSRDSRDRRG
jgi:hypothetical protein